jgi:hypothetical protein
LMGAHCNLLCYDGTPKGARHNASHTDYATEKRCHLCAYVIPIMGNERLVHCPCCGRKFRLRSRNVYVTRRARWPESLLKKQDALVTPIAI